MRQFAGYKAFEGTWGERAQLARDTIDMKATKGIPSWMFHTMDVPFMEQVLQRPPGTYVRDRHGSYLEFQRRAGTCFIDQYLPENPLTMRYEGFEATTKRSATTGDHEIVIDAMRIDSPEAVVAHLETYVFPQRRRQIAAYDPTDAARIARLVESECAIQRLFGPDILKGPYADGFQAFPRFHNYTYGYENYFMAYALFPEVMEQDFALQADLALLENEAAAQAILAGGLPPLVRLDYDMADSRGTLVDIRSLDAIWFPHFARAIRPFLDAGIRLIWHCDGNLWDMLPRLLECGIGGFQGFQYEDGMDYERICRMTDRNGGPLFIIAGVSVTRTLPFGTKDDVIREMKWLVANGPPVGLMLGPSSSITPGVPHENLKAMMEGLKYYREHGRDA